MVNRICSIFDDLFHCISFSFHVRLTSTTTQSNYQIDEQKAQSILLLIERLTSQWSTCRTILTDEIDRTQECQLAHLNKSRIIDEIESIECQQHDENNYETLTNKLIEYLTAFELRMDSSTNTTYVELDQVDCLSIGMNE
jgi:TnpA family transposase